MGNCYKLSYKFKNPYNYKFSDFLVYFNQSIPWRDLPKLNAFFTSEKNAYGIALRVWKNGKVAKVEVDKSFRRIVDLIPEKFTYMETKCSYESFYECFSRLIKNSNASTSVPGSLPSLPICKMTNLHPFWKFWDKVSKNGQCPKICHTLQYYLETSNPFKKTENNVTFQLGFRINSNTILHEEYLIYDVTSMIGSVGGTFGMCIGFSFTGILSSFMRLLNLRINVHT